MRIAIPVDGVGAVAGLAGCTAVRFYEDDHGRVTRQYAESVTDGFDAALSAIERSGVDVVVCGPLTPEEKRALAINGLLLSPDASGDADEALHGYLSAAIACDPNNTCNYCGHKDECALPHKKTDG